LIQNLIYAVREVGKWGSGEVGKWGSGEIELKPQHPKTPTPKTCRPPTASRLLYDKTCPDRINQGCEIWSVVGVYLFNNGSVCIVADSTAVIIDFYGDRVYRSLK
jgi:hypothetical protein